MVMVTKVLVMKLFCRILLLLVMKMMITFLTLKFGISELGWHRAVFVSPLKTRDVPTLAQQTIHGLLRDWREYGTVVRRYGHLLPQLLVSSGDGLSPSPL